MMREDVVIDRAARAVREMEVPGGPPEAMMRRVRGMDRRFPIGRVMVTAAAVLVAIGVVWSMAGMNSHVAFADVVQQLKQVQTVHYLEVTTQGGMPVTTSRETVDMAGKFSRSETLVNGKVRHIAIYNQGKMLNLDPETKTGSLMDYTTADGLPHTLADTHTLADLLKVDAATAESLGEKVIDGTKRAGFRLNRDYDKFTKRRVEVWVDVKTRLPVRVEERSSMRYPDEAQSKALAESAKERKANVRVAEQERMMEKWPEMVTTRILTEIVFHGTLEESAFSVETAPGYTVTATKVGE